MSVDKTTLSFSAQVGGPTLQQPLNLSSSSGSFGFTTFVNTSWLGVNPTSGTVPSAVTVTANPSGLAAGSYQGTLTIFGFANNTSTNSVSVSVTLVVGNVGVNPASLQLSYQIGAPTPAPQTLALTGQSASINVAATTASGGSWLGVTPVLGAAPGTLTVSLLQPALGALATGTYNGTVTITPSGSAPITVAVTLTVSPAPPVTISPQSVALEFQTGGSSNSAQQTFTLATTGTQGVPFTLTPTFGNTPCGCAWFTVNPSSTGTIPANGNAPITVSYNTAANLPAGTYTGQVQVSTPGGTPQAQNVPVTLLVSNSPLLSTSTTALSFTYQVGTPVPAAQSVTVNSTNGALPLTISATTAGNSGNWLTVPATGTAGTAFSVAVSPTGLAPGTYTGTISVTGNAANSPQMISVTLKVANDPVIVINANGCSTVYQPCPLTFADQIGQAPPAPQNVQVSSTTGAALNYTATAASTSCGGNWLSVGGATTGASPGTFSVSVNASGIAAGTQCAGTVTVAAANAASGNATPNSPFSIPVTLYVSNTPLLVVNPSALVFSGQVNGGQVLPQTLTLSSTSATDQITYTITSATTNGSNWLFLNSQAGSTAAPNNTLSVSVIPGLLSPGTYSGSVTITGTGPGGAAVADSPITIPITFQVNAGTIAASPASLTFAQAAGGSTPTAQTVNITATPGAINYSVSATTNTGGNWLSVAPTSGTTPGSIQVSASAGTLAVGQYTGTVTITAATPPGATGSPISIPVTLNVTSAQTLSASPSTLTFSYITGASAPATQSVQISATGGAAPFSAAATTASGGNWLQVTPATGTTPGTVTVSVTPQSLSPGQYTGTVTVSSSNAVTATTITVNLNVSTIPKPIVTQISNAGSYSLGATSPGISPGENIAIFGTGIGPAVLIPGTVTTGGTFDTMAGNTQVLFDGVPAPVLYASSTQTSVMVPYGVFGRASTTIRVVFQGVQSDPIVYNVVLAAPGIYTLNQSGTGPGAILNQTTGVNGPSNPAAKGEVIAIYMTGEGQTAPAGTDGALAPTNGTGLNKPLLPVSATVGGVPATVQYAGSAPGIVYGVMQVNLTIPSTVASGAQPVVITLGTPGSPQSFSSQSGVTVAVK